MARDDSRKLLVAEGFEVARRSQVVLASFTFRERAIGDLTNERLDEGVLSARRCPRVGLDRQDLASDEQVETRLECRRCLARDRGQSFDAECLAEDRGILEDRAIGRREAIEPGRDEGVERRWDLQGAHVDRAKGLAD